MAIFAVSDIVIAFTLVINALALVSSRFKPADSGMTRSKSGGSTSSLISSSGEQSGAFGGRSQSLSYARLAQLASSRNRGSFGNGAGDDGNSESDNLLSLGTDATVESNDSPSPRDLMSAGERIKRLLYSIRKLSCLILFWNVVFTILMVLVFER